MALTHVRVFKVIEPEVFWLYGLSGAGKSTIGLAVAKVLNESNKPTVLLDGDNLRLGICQDLGFSPEDRLENVRRVAELAKLLREQGFFVIAALMTPHEIMRQMARSIIGDEFFKEVFVKCDYKTCASRDTKGLYAKAASGNLFQFPGKDLMFEEPIKPDLVLDTVIASIQTCASSLMNKFNLL
jgi:adenylyl-sulfate kinase